MKWAPFLCPLSSHLCANYVQRRWRRQISVQTLFCCIEPIVAITHAPHIVFQCPVFAKSISRLERSCRDACLMHFHCTAPLVLLSSGHCALRILHPPKHEMKTKWPLEMPTDSPGLERIKQINICVKSYINFDRSKIKSVSAKSMSMNEKDAKRLLSARSPAFEPVSLYNYDYISIFCSFSLLCVHASVASTINTSTDRTVCHLVLDVRRTRASRLRDTRYYCGRAMYGMCGRNLVRRQSESIGNCNSIR